MSMITPDYALTMARYNAWQNKQLKAIFQAMDQAELWADRGAFFGSIMKTASHLVWGDWIWMSRFDGGSKPDVPGAQSTDLFANREQWAIARDRMDARIVRWAEGLSSVDLGGSLTWHSGTVDADVSKPLALCVTHMFNHQTHHRGQIHAMLTAAGAKAPVSDLAFMPEPEAVRR